MGRMRSPARIPGLATLRFHAIILRSVLDPEHAPFEESSLEGPDEPEDILIETLYGCKPSKDQVRTAQIPYNRLSSTTMSPPSLSHQQMTNAFILSRIARESAGRCTPAELDKVQSEL